MAKEWHQYTSDDIDVRWSKTRCIHAARCVSTLPAVWDTDQRPWVQPANAPADEVAKVVHLCPTGALQYTRKDGGDEEPAPANRILVTDDGPLYVRGALTLVDGEGEVQFADETRLALCRCGASGNKPLCDNSHQSVGFSAKQGSADEENDDSFEPTGGLRITSTKNGPFVLKGQFELLNADDEVMFQGEKSALCRCGQSSNKPFCDGTHTAVGFEG